MTLALVSRLVAGCSFPGVLPQLPLSLQSAGVAGSGKSLDNERETQHVHKMRLIFCKKVNKAKNA